MKVKYAIVIDTETAPICSGQLKPENSRAYDCGFTVVDLTHEIIVERHSYIVADTFFDSMLMDSAYYAEKLPQYYDGMGRAWIVKSMCEVYNIVRDIFRKYQIKDVYAYNARFDLVNLNKSVEDSSNGFVKYFFPHGTKIHDLWRMASQAGITASRKYVRFCIKNNYISEKGNPLTSAEICYRYLKSDTDFIEAHTALSDAEIETEILFAIRRRKRKHDDKLGCGWQAAAKIKKEMED